MVRSSALRLKESKGMLVDYEGILLFGKKITLMPENRAVCGELWKKR